MEGSVLRKFFGINIAVKDLDEAMAKYEALLGVKPVIVSDRSQFAFPGITAAVFDFNGVRINLLTSSEANNPVSKFLESRGEGLLLISLASDDIERDVADRSAKGLSFISPNCFAGGYGKVNFIHPRVMNGVQVEIIEPAMG